MEHKFTFKRTLGLLLVLAMVFSSVAVFAFSANAETTESVILIDAVNAASWAEGVANYGAILVYGTENTVSGYIGGVWNSWWYKIFATYDEAEQAFVVSEVLPNDGDAAYADVTLDEGEIIILVYPGAEATDVATANAAAAVKAGDKLVATGFDFTNESAADIITQDGENLASSVYFTVTPAVVDDDDDGEDTPVVESTNIALGKTYTASEQFRMGGQEVGWGWDENAPICYADEEGITMTDGIIPAEDADYQAVEWAGWTGQTPSVLNGTVYNWIIVDLGESTDLEKFVVWHGNTGLGNGIGSPDKIEVFVSEDGQTWDEEPVASAEPAKNADIILESTTIEAEATGRYVQFRIHGGNWSFLAEIEIYNKGSEDDDTSDPDEDDDEDLEAVLKEFVGEASEDAKFDLEINAPETYKAGDEITVTVTVKNITAENGLHVVNFNLYYDCEKLVLTNDLDEEDDNRLVCIDEENLPSKWENFTKVNNDFDAEKPEGTVVNADNDGIIYASALTDKDTAATAIKEDGAVVFTFTFTAVEDAEGDIGIAIPNAEVEGALNNEAGAELYAGNGGYVIIANDDAQEDESSEADPVVPGDASNMLVFAIIALVAIAGSAVVIKTRR